MPQWLRYYQWSVCYPVDILQECEKIRGKCTNIPTCVQWTLIGPCFQQRLAGIKRQSALCWLSVDNFFLFLSFLFVFANCANRKYELLIGVTNVFSLYFNIEEFFFVCVSFYRGTAIFPLWMYLKCNKCSIYKNKKKYTTLTYLFLFAQMEIASATKWQRLFLLQMLFFEWHLDFQV